MISRERIPRFLKIRSSFVQSFPLRVRARKLLHKRDVALWRRQVDGSPVGHSSIVAETPVEIIPQGDRLMVRTNQDRANMNQRITDDLEIVLPKGMAIESRGWSPTSASTNRRTSRQDN